ncbi:MAG TPA: SpoIVB peptidase S55 domain-containing protein, partial [Limnochordales bacterium]
MTALRRTVIMGMFAWAVAAILGAAAEARFFSIEALEPGMRGTAKTVVRGTEVETFEVEFLGVLPQAGPSGDLILIRASGDVIDRTGGIAAGMSGSPVYIGDQLVGAIGYGYDFADHRIGMVTPIDDMLAVMKLMDAGAAAPAGTGVVETRAQDADRARAVPRAAVLARSLAEAEALAAALP